MAEGIQQAITHCQRGEALEAPTAAVADMCWLLVDILITALRWIWNVS